MRTATPFWKSAQFISSMCLALLLAACSTPTNGNDGAPGPAGPAGPTGPRGADGANGASATTTAELPGVNCINGGVKIQVGTAAPSYVCQGTATKYYVFVRGHLKSPTASVNKAAHDQIVASSRAAATAAGDERHLAFLGMSDPRNLLVIDIWNSLTGLQGFLNDPNVQAGFASLFDAPPSVTVTVEPQGFSSWGTLAPRPNTWVVSVRGTLKHPTFSGNQAAHNQVANGGQAAAISLGDYGHLPFLKSDDLSSFQAVDEWADQNGMNTFLNDPQVQAAFGGLFAGPPTIDVYATSDYAQY